MPWSAPVSPTPGTTILVAYATANIVNPIVWLRLMTGNADPPAANYVVVSTGGASTSWQKVPGDALAAGAAVTNLGYTPINKAGDTTTGQLVIWRTQGAASTAFSTAPLSVQSLDAAANPAETAGIGLHRLNASGVYFFHGGAAAADILRIITNTGAAGTVWHSLNHGSGSGLDADTLDGVQGSGYAPAANQVPSGAIVAFRTAAEVAAAGAGWAVETNLQGKMIVGAGTAGGSTFTEATNYGTNWQVATSASTTSGGPVQGGGSSSADPQNHVHNVSLIVPSRAYVYARKT